MLSMSEAGSLSGGVGMLGPFDTLYEQPKPRFIFKMPRVVPDQKHKFETDELFRRLSRESEVSMERVLMGEFSLSRASALYSLMRNFLANPIKVIL